MPVASMSRLASLYYSVQVGKTLLWVAADLIVFYILAIIDRLSPETVSIVLVGGLAWHAISDLAVGLMLRHERLSARQLSIVAGLAVPICAASFVISVLSAPSSTWMALAFMMLFRSTYALFDIPHHALLGRMSGLGFDTGRLVSMRNLWGQIASVALALSMGPRLNAHASQFVVLMLLIILASSAAVLSLPIVILVRQLWNRSDRFTKGRAVQPPSGNNRRSIGFVLIANLAVTVVVATASKAIIGNVPVAIATPGAALAALTIGKLLSCIPLPEVATRWRIETAFVAGLITLVLFVVVVIYRPSDASFACFGLASGWVNILTWTWISQITKRADTFAFATITTKIGMMVSIPAAAMMLV